jgi:hypothetical protein
LIRGLLAANRLDFLDKQERPAVHISPTRELSQRQPPDEGAVISC